MQEFRKDFSLEKQWKAFRVPLQRALRTGWINAAIVTLLLLPWTRKAHLAFGVAVYSG